MQTLFRFSDDGHWWPSSCIKAFIDLIWDESEPFVADLPAFNLNLFLSLTFHWLSSTGNIIFEFAFRGTSSQYVQRRKTETCALRHDTRLSVSPGPPQSCTFRCYKCVEASLIPKARADLLQLHHIPLLRSLFLELPSGWMLEHDNELLREGQECLGKNSLFYMKPSWNTSQQLSTALPPCITVADFSIMHEFLLGKVTFEACIFRSATLVVAQREWKKRSALCSPVCLHAFPRKKSASEAGETMTHADHTYVYLYVVRTYYLPVTATYKLCSTWTLRSWQELSHDLIVEELQNHQ